MDRVWDQVDRLRKKNDFVAGISISLTQLIAKFFLLQFHSAPENFFIHWLVRPKKKINTFLIEFEIAMQ